MRVAVVEHAATSYGHNFHSDLISQDAPPINFLSAGNKQQH